MAESLYRGDRYLRNLLPGQGGIRAPWAAAMRAVNRLPGLRLDPAAPARAAVSWASDALRAHVPLPESIDVALERTIHPATTHEGTLNALERTPAEPPEVLYLGRMTTAKGIEVAYRAIALLRREHGIDARLVQAGAAKPEMERALAGWQTSSASRMRSTSVGRLTHPRLRTPSPGPAPSCFRRSSGMSLASC